MNIKSKNFLLPASLWIIFVGIAIGLWLYLDNIFYLINFSYIGTALAVSVFLYLHKFRHARHFAQLLIGMYMFIYLGIICGENMQIEGFWYYLFTGTFEAAVIHYAVAKLFGPLVFGRGWCGYASWTAMVLDFLPYKIPQKPRKNMSNLRYAVFALSLSFILFILIKGITGIDHIMFISFIIGNVAYYVIGIILAFKFEDNRAFCKYLCPITVFLKPMSYFSLIRIKCNKSLCIDCGLCKKACPMDVDVTDNSRKRKNGTECILCMECVNACPKKAL